MVKKDKVAFKLAAQDARKKDKELRKKYQKQRSKDVFKLTPVYQKFFKDFNDQLKVLALQMRDVGGDGNCLFRAISDQLEGNEELFEVFRKEACRHMKQNQDFYSLYLDEDDGNITQYIRQMGRDGAWGGNLQLQALSQLMNMNIVIHRKLPMEETIIEPWNQKTDKNRKRFTIHLAYFQQQDFEHYASVRVYGDTSKNPAINSLAGHFKYKHLNFGGYNQQQVDQYQMLTRLQMEEFGLDDSGDESKEQEEEPFPNYPLNKKCKCNSGQPYKNCCRKEYQKRKASRC